MRLNQVIKYILYIQRVITANSRCQYLHKILFFFFKLLIKPNMEETHYNTN